MIHQIPLHKLLLLDIETVPEYEFWKDLPENWQELWAQKTIWQRKDEISAEAYYPQKAGILAEFGKIVCISIGFIHQETIRLKSFYGFDEKELLLEFAELLNSQFYLPDYILCAYNGKEFDFPFLSRRLLIHQIPQPNILNLHGKKPWETQHLDAMELWKFGDYKHFTSLNLLATTLGIDTPKDDIDGSQVADVFYKEKNIERIKTYCEKDVITLGQIMRRFRYEPLLKIE